MQSPFPPFAAVALHRGNSENLQFVGVGVDGSLGLPAWQVGTAQQFDWKGGEWVVQGTNLVSFQQRVFSSTALGTGDGGELWVVGVDGDQHIHLAARQDPQGLWHAPGSGESGVFGPPRQTFSAVATGTGDKGGLQLLALGTDGKVYRVGYQESGLWYSSTGGPLGDQARTYGSIAVARAADGTLQALGLGTDRKLHLVAHQDREGQWQPPSARNSGAIGNNSRPYTAIAVSPGNDRRLQVLGLGADGKVYLIAWLDGSDWKTPNDKNRNPLGNEGRPYVAIAAGTGNGGRLQVLGLGDDQKIYHVAWQETSGEWKRPRNSGPFGNPELSYSAMALGHGYKGDLQVAGLGAGFDDGLPYLVTRQDGDGNWHAGQPLFSGRSSPLEGNWEAALPGGAWLNGCLAYDTVWVVTGDNAVRGFDHFTGRQTHVFPRFGEGSPPRDVQPFQDGLLVYCNDGWLYFVDLGTEAPPQRIAYTDSQLDWMQAQGGSVFGCSGTTGVVRVPPEAEGVPPSRDGQIIIGAYGAGYTVGNPSLGPDMVLATVSNGERLCALDPVDLSLIRSCPLPAAPSWITSACNGSIAVLCVDDAKTVCAVPTSLEKVAWTVTFSAPVSYQLACDASYCYVPLSDGSVKILNIADGTPAKGKTEIKLPGPLNTLLLDGGVLYGASYAGSFICAIDIATGQVLTLPTSSPTLIGAENGVVYFGDQKQVRAMRLAGLFRRFYAEATLMQDIDIPAPGLGAAPAKVPGIQTEITLYDKAGGPYARQQVRVGATEPVEIWCNGVRHAIGTPDVPFATLPTDVAGRVRIGQRPTNLTCPSLTLFTTFMDGDLSLLLRPDAQLHDTLADIKGEDLKNAVGYDRKPIVKPEYRGDDKVLDNTARMMSASIQMVKGSLDRRQTLLAGTLAHRQMRYLARGCDMETICCCPLGDYTCRAVCNRNFAFDLSAATTSFGYLDPAQTEAWLAEHPLSLTPPPPRPGSPEGWWDDFWEDVKDGAAAVKNAIIYAADQIADNVKTVVTWIKQGASYTFEFVVDTIEKAVALVQGIFNTIVGAVGKVLQALSFLFSRDRIVGIKTQLRNQVNDAWTRLLGPDGQTDTGLLFQARDLVSGELAGLRNSIDKVLGDVRAQAGGISGAAAQQRVAGAASPAEGGSTSRWLEAKIGDNLLSPTALRAGLPAAGHLQAGIPDFPIPAGLDKDVGDLVREVEQVVGQEAAAALRRIQSELDPDGTGTSLFGSAFSAIVDLMQFLADVAIEAAERIWVAMINVLAKLLRAIRAFTTTAFYLPVVSELYAYFTDSPVDSLTVLDLACLLAAVPTSLLLPDSSEQEAGSAAGAPVPQILGIASGALQALATAFMGTYAAVVTALRADEYFGPVMRTRVKVIQSLIFLGVGGAARGLLLASDICSNLHHDNALIVNTALWSIPTLVLAGDCASILLVNESMGWLSKNLSVVFGMVCSIGMAAIMGRYHDLFQSNWPLIAFNSLVAGAFFLRGLLVFGNAIPEGGYRLAYQLAVIGVATGLLVGSGFVKMWGAANPPPARSDPGTGPAVHAMA